ncbi:MAG: hypothetical protein RMJ17_00560 [Candidatus Aenigmarchaeota archaeon]|nr:hypothetical protein [Candidatus Aenigmarchaeota archaeon]MDW8149079.1 hypothetical protein [Candidatus Aenigmarchaeota archaeon]
MLYKDFYNNLSGNILSSLNSKGRLIFKKLDYYYESERVFQEIFASFDLTHFYQNFIENFRKELYVEKFLKKKISRIFSKEQQEQILSSYHNTVSEAVEVIVDIFYGSRQMLKILYEDIEYIKRQIKGSVGYGGALYGFSEHFVTLFEDNYHTLLYFLEFLKIKDLLFILRWPAYNLKIVKASLELEEKNELIDLIIKTTVSWYRTLSKLKDFEELTYFEYIVKTNNQEEMFFRNKLIQLFSSDFFASLFIYWFNTITSYDYKYWENFDFKRLYFEIRDWNPIKDWGPWSKGWPFVIAPIGLGSILKDFDEYLHKNIFKPSFPSKFDSFLGILKNAILSELFIYIMDYFYSYVEHILSFPNIKEKMKNYLYYQKFPQYLIENPKRSILVYYLNYLANNSYLFYIDNFLHIPKEFLPSGFNKEMVAAIKNMAKITRFCFLGIFKKNWKDMLKNKDKNRNTRITSFLNEKIQVS